jgi:uncharacterized protein (DUF1501 family)
MPTHPEHPSVLDRRRFLLGALAATGVLGANAPTAAASPRRPPRGPEVRLPKSDTGPQRELAGLTRSTRQLVLLNLAGGNDAVNTFIDADANQYRAVRRSVALPTDRLRAVDGGRLHPALSEVQRLVANGQGAIIPGLGVPGATLSHFSAAAQWMGGGDTDTRPTGWLGRALDSVASAESFAGVHIGSELPLVLRGNSFRAVTLPDSAVRAFGADRTVARSPGVADPTRLVAAIESMATGRTDASLASQWARGGANAVRHAAVLAPALRALPEATTDRTPIVVRHLQLAAGLLNLDTGIRVVSVVHSGYDTHASHLPQHDRLLSDLNTGLSRFFSSLTSATAASTAVLIVTEFGRRVVPNASQGLDHGGSHVGFLLGAPVIGGVKAPAASLTTLDSQGNQPSTVDVRRIFAESLTWLGLPQTVAGAPRSIGLLR